MAVDRANDQGGVCFFPLRIIRLVLAHVANEWRFVMVARYLAVDQSGVVILPRRRRMLCCLCHGLFPFLLVLGCIFAMQPWPSPRAGCASVKRLRRDPKSNAVFAPS